MKKTLKIKNFDVDDDYEKRRKENIESFVAIFQKNKIINQVFCCCFLLFGVFIIIIMIILNHDKGLLLQQQQQQIK